MSKYHQGIYNVKNPKKYLGDSTNVIYRSSWELKMFQRCDSDPNIISWVSEEIIIPYLSLIDNKLHRYFVDLKITIKDKSNNIKTYLVEIKPHNQTQKPIQKVKKTKRFIRECLEYEKNISKWKSASKYANSMGWEFIILTEKGSVKICL